MIIIGLTGSIGMGKSTAARILKEEFQIPVHDSDHTAHVLMDYNGAAVQPILDVFPTVSKTNENGEVAIDRSKLGKIVFQDNQLLKKLEAILHPLIKQHSDDFLINEFNKGSEIVILDVPLLYETHGDKRCDGVLVVTVSPQTQRERVFSRDKHMTEERFQSVLAKQVPNDEKCLRADFILSMENGLDQAKKDIAMLVPQFKALKAKKIHELRTQKGL